MFASVCVFFFHTPRLKNRQVQAPDLLYFVLINQWIRLLVEPFIIVMPSSLVNIIIRLLQYNLDHGAKLMRFLITPLSSNTNLIQFWRSQIVPKPNPYQVFQTLRKSPECVQPLEFKEFERSIRTDFEEGNLIFVRDSLRKGLSNSAQNIHQLKDLRNQLYYANHQQHSQQALKTIIEMDAKLYLEYKEKGFAKQMDQQLDLILTSLNRFKQEYSDDPEIKEFRMNQIACLYEKVNLLKSQKRKQEYIVALEKLYKLELQQQESAQKQKYCNRLLRKICIYHLLEKDVKPILDYYHKMESDSQRRIVRHYLSDFV